MKAFIYLLLHEHIISYLSNLSINFHLPTDVEVMNPYQDVATMEVVKNFYGKYYADNNSRFLIVGINPGRFGGGVTGIPFTDPIRLRQYCHIENNWPAKQELSSVFVYNLISRFGGPEEFYKRFFFTSISPLGFVKHGKNMNYYDDKALATAVEPFAVKCFLEQIDWGMSARVVFCLGEGTNYKYFNLLNQRHKLFDEIVPLPHPRFIMQYKLKSSQLYVEKYLAAFTKAINKSV